MIPSSSSLRRSYNYYDDLNPNSRPQEDPPPFVLDHFPSHFLDHHHDHNQLLFFMTRDNINSPQPQQLKAQDEHIRGGAYINIPADQNTQDISMNATLDDHPMPSSEVLAPKMIKKSSGNKGAAKKQRKSGKKDRRSKICTAQGIRDRRMRLSLHIARKFFDLQDMLGFDKASKTIDWLFSKSKKAIKKLSCTTTNHLPQINMISTNTAYHNNTTRSGKSDSSMSSECEVESEGENVSGVRKAQKSQTAAYGNNPINPRKTRDKARARARERTREKMMIRCLEKSPHYYLSDQTSASTYNLAKLGSSDAPNPNSIFETVNESSVRSYATTQDQRITNSPHEYSSSHASLHHQMANVGIVASSSAVPAVSCSIFDYQKSGALFSGGFDSYSNKFDLGFLENWNINSNISAMTTNIYGPNIY